ncbi:MAG: response regulator [Oscillospiraceae bacterium]|nr:response regulator [Oscillospiraceae bacterium]
MLKRERLLEISGLDSDKIRETDDKDLEVFAIAVSCFIDGLPAQERDIKNALKTKNRGVLFETLIGICDFLQEVFATKLAEECLNKIDSMKDADFEELQPYVIEFIKAAYVLSIDLQMAESVEIEELPTEEEEPKPELNNKILAVDDRFFFLEYIKSMLENTGYEITCISSGAKALEYLRGNRPDLFILDIEMPEMDGYELAAKIREYGHTAPIIFFTGNAKKNTVVKALQVGVSDFIVKTASKTQVLERIGKYIKPGMAE